MSHFIFKKAATCIIFEVDFAGPFSANLATLKYQKSHVLATVF